MTKEQFLKRCETIWDMGLAGPDVLLHVLKSCDAVHRLEGGQTQYFIEFMEQERMRTDGFVPGKTLANDALGYSTLQLMSLLCHPCQECAEDREAWHTRWGFCCHDRARS
jgi:hypothetical protein